MSIIKCTHFKLVFCYKLDRIAFISLLFCGGEDSIYPLHDILLSFRVYVKLRHTFARGDVCLYMCVFEFYFQYILARKQSMSQTLVRWIQN